jgi:hypothetical protein
MKISLLTPMLSSVKGARLSSLGRHGDRTSTFDRGELCRNPLPTRADQLLGERVFLWWKPAGCGTSQPQPRAKGRGESRRSFGLGSLNPALETLAGLALKVAFLHRLESSIRTPRDSIKAADQNHRFTGFTGESRLFGLQGSLPAVAPCRGESQSLISPPSRPVGRFCPTAGGKEALRISSRWRNRNRSGSQFSNSHATIQ